MHPLLASVEKVLNPVDLYPHYSRKFPWHPHRPPHRPEIPH